MANFRLFLLLFLFCFLPVTLSAQEMLIDFGEDSSAATTIKLLLIVTVISLAPGIAITVTCFPFIITVFSILRQAVGLQQSPPNMLLISLSLFLTYFVMEDVFFTAYTSGIAPLSDGLIELEEAVFLTLEPFKEFMLNRVDQETLLTFSSLIDVELEQGGEASVYGTLIPSFIISEITKAFQIGFLVFLPFLIIDLVVAAILMSMGMMMVPPAIVSLPFKLAFFVLADGWSLISESLVRSYI